MSQIIITDCDHDNINDEKAVFEAAGVTYTLEQCHTEDDLIAKCQDAVACLNQYAPFTEKVFAALPKLKLVARYGVGVDNVDLKAATRHGVTVCNVPDYGTAEVADQALALMLELTRKCGQADALVKSGVWDYSRLAPITRLSCLKVGIVGVGRIGSAFAKRVHALGCEVQGYDIRTEQVTSNPELSFVKMTTLEEVLATSDVISVHSALTPENPHMFNAETFGKMKNGALFINAARGGLVDEEALAEALNSGKLGGAGIDVTQKEPLPMDSKLRTCPNIVITPHIAWYSEEASHDLKRKCAEEAVRAVKGEAPRCPVN